MPCCSYCMSSEHNIRNCISPNILIHYNHIKTIFDEITLRSNNRKLDFINEICRIYNLSIIKVVSVKFTYSNASLNKKEHSLRLFNHFNNIVSYTPDIIPSYAQDLNQFNESNDIIWFMDRNPMINFTPEFIPVTPIINQRFNYEDYIYEDYIAAEDEFIPIPRNLENEFNAEKKKYYITPIVSRFKFNEKKCNNLEECPICYETLKYEDIVTLNCNHEFCKTCIIQTLHCSKNENPSCALCRKEICSILVPDVKTYDSIAEFCI